MSQIVRLFGIFFALSVGFLSHIPASAPASAQEYAADGMPLVTTFRIRNAATNTYLKAHGSRVIMAPLKADDDAFLWVLDETGSPTRAWQQIANVATGWFLMKGNGNGGLYVGVPQPDSIIHWRLERGQPATGGALLVSQPRNGDRNIVSVNVAGLHTEGAGIAARPGASFNDKAFVWHLEPGPGRDLIKVTIDRVKAIQTSTGRDGATNVLTSGIVVALEWGPALAGAGAGGALKGAIKGIAKGAAKKGAKAGGKSAAKKSLKEIAKEGLENLARDGILSTAAKMARKAGSKGHSAARWVERKARKLASKTMKKGSTAVAKKKNMLRRYMKDPTDALTLTNLGKTTKRSISLTKKIIKAPDTLQKAEDALNSAGDRIAGIFLDANGKQITSAAEAKPNGAGSPALQSPASPLRGATIVPVAAQGLAPTEHEIGLARQALKTLADLEAPEVEILRQTCDSPLDAQEPQSPINVVTIESLEEFSSTLNDLKQALSDSDAVEAIKDIDDIMVEAFVNPFGSMMDTIVNMTNDSDDALEIRFNGNSVWPNGGGDHRDISKGDTKDVGVERVLPRSAGVDIQLVEYDYASDDDNLGHLTFKTDGMREAQTFREALIYSKSEGSLYAIDVSVKPLATGETKQEAEVSRVLRACDRLAGLQSKVVDAFSRLERYVKATQDLQEKYGLEGIAVYDNSVVWEKAKACPGKSADYASLLAGDWRVGRYDDVTGEKLRDKTWTYTFSADGVVLTPKLTGNWATTSYFNTDMWGKPRKDDWYTTPRSCELYTAFHSQEIVRNGSGGNYYYSPQHYRRDQKKHLNGYSQLKSQLLYPIRSEADGLAIYSYEEKSKNNDILNFARNAFQLTDYRDENRVKHDATVTGRAGLDVWMEKIDDGRAKVQDSPERIKQAQDYIKGIWRIAQGGAPAGFETKWTFTSDNLFVASNYYSAQDYGWITSDAPLDERARKVYRVENISGTWEYFGDNRIQVKLDEENKSKFYEFIGLKQAFIIYLGYEENVVEGYESFYVPAWMDQNHYGRNTTEKGITAQKVLTDIKYPYLDYPYIDVRGADKLEEVREKKGLPIPKDEEEEYKWLLNDRAQKVENERVRELENQEYERFRKLVDAQEPLWDKTREARRLRYNEWNSKCGEITEEDKSSLLGEWSVGLVDRIGGKQALPTDEAKWTFRQDGTLTGLIGKKSWTAIWTAESGCHATAKFDAATAAYFELETDVDIHLVFRENGDKEFYVLERETATRIARRKLEDTALVAHTEYDARYRRQVTYMKLANEKFVHDYFYDVGDKTMSAFGTQLPDPETTARFILKYDDRIITRAGLSNRCSDRWVNGRIRPGNRPKGRRIGLDIRSVSGPSYSRRSNISIYKVNFEGPEAEEVYTGTVGDTGPAWEAEIFTHAFKGVVGDEFVVLDDENNCLKVYQTTGLSTPARDRFKFGTDRDHEAETTLYYDKDLKPEQKLAGCSTFQWAQSAEYLWTDIERKIGNSGSEEMFVYKVDKDGLYRKEDPVLAVKPGELATLKAKVRERYTMLAADHTCLAVATIDDDINPQLIFGDGSKPITNPDFLTPSQVGNGCLDHNKVSSSYANNGGKAHITNSGMADLSVFWVGYDGKYDLERPAVTIKPGQTAEIVDFLGARYEVLDPDRQCVAIVRPYYYNADAKSDVHRYVLGDGTATTTATATGTVIDRFEQAGINPSTDLTRHQIANGCRLYGQIASKPSWNTGWDRTIVNAGTKTLTVHWLSFYGQLEDQEGVRSTKPNLTIAPGERITTEKYTDGDVFSVLEVDGQCVAVIQAQDLFTEDPDVHSRVGNSPNSGRKSYYVLRDRKSAEEFDARVVEWNRGTIAHKEKVSELEALWTKGNCGTSWSQIYQELRGGWEVGSYDRSGRRRQFGPKPTIWKFAENFQLEGNGPDGKPFSTQAMPDNCTVKADIPGGGEIKLIFRPDGAREFYAAPSRLPEILYSDGTTEVNRETTPEPQLVLWGTKLPSIGAIDDADGRADEIDEGARIGSPVGITAGATDPDDMVSYSLESYGDHKGLFAIDPQTGVVSVAGNLDFETAKSHTVTVTAVSTDSSSSRRQFEIAVRNVNESAIGEIVDADEARISDYTYGSYGVGDRMYESVEVGQRVAITAQAKDADSDDKISYSLSDDAGGLFAIDPVSGVITVAGKLDWEAAPSHEIEVTATSSDGSTNRKTFEIPLADASEFSVSEVTDTDERPNVLDETAPIGTEVGVTAFATDADGSATVTYSIYDNRNGSAFMIDAETGVLTLNMDLNREHYEDIAINVKATSSDGSSSERTFTIAINDVDEFDVTEITNGDWRPITVREDAEIGARIFLDAEARDEDATDEVTFSIANPEDVPFVIDPKSGEVTVGSRSLDEAEITSYTLVIVATSSDGSESRKSFEVPVVDINEFKVSALTDIDDAFNEVFENAAAGTRVGITAFAEDRDGSDDITYSLSGNYSAFAIDPKSGLITVSRSGVLDTETKPVETISVVATSTDRSTSWFDFEVAIIDADEFEVGHPADNDNAPNEVEENAPVGTSVGITAFAEDFDASDMVTYQLADDGRGLFAIDPVSGVVTVAGPLDFETAPQGYTITVTASSSDGSVTQYPLRQDIRLNDVDEFDVTEPVDTDPNVNEVQEKAPRGTPVGISAKASDADGSNNRISYVILDDSGRDLTSAGGPFSVDWDGVVTTTDLSMLDVDGKITGTFLRVIAYSEDGSESEARFEIGVVYAPKWWENPAGPRVEADFPTVPEADRQACIAADENWKNQATFNNENAYFDCLQAAIPPLVLWRDDPRDPRGDNLAIYDGIPHDDYGACRNANDNEASQTFNNETAYYDCLDSVLERVKPSTGSGGGLVAGINACAAEHQVYHEAPVDADAQMTVTNTGPADLYVYAVTAPGTAEFAATPVAVVMPGQSAEFIARRQEGFAVMGQGDVCVGAIKAWESRNSASFAQSEDTLAGADAGVGEQGEPKSSDGTPDARAGKDYSSVPVDANEACGTAWPNSPQDDKGYYDCMDTALATLEAGSAIAPTASGDAPSGPDPRANKDYSVVSVEANDACGVAWPNSPQDDKGYYDCMDAALDTGGNQQGEGSGNGIDLNPGGAYSDLPQDVLQTCQGDISCLDAARSQASRADAQGIDYRISNEYPDLTQDEIRGCDDTEYGSDDFFACLGQVQAAKLSAADGQTPANDNQPSGDGQEPGWDRATVFYQPAYDYCLGERGLELDSAAYGECYYAYPNY